jgi:hypothetical protein
MAEKNGLTGRCECGNVQLKISGDPMFSANCHCLVCQHLSGAGHVFFLVFPQSNVEVTGNVSQYKYKADSGRMAATHFCPNCGSRLYGTGELVPGTYGVMAGCLDNTSAYRPKVTAYAKRLQAWDQMAAEVPSFPTMPPM